MNFQLVLTSPAEEDIQNATFWYNDKRKGLGKEFLLSVEAALEAIKRNPKHYQVKYKQVRIVFIRRFPYGVYYTIDKDKVVVLATLHTKMNDTNWKKRL